MLWLTSSVAHVPRACAQIELTTEGLDGPIVVSADTANHWRQGAYDVWLLRGHCLVQQDLTYARSQEAVIWVEQAAPDSPELSRAIVYLEGDVQIEQNVDGQATRIVERSWFGRFSSVSPIEVRVANPGPEPKTKPAVWHAAMAKRDPYARDALQQAQFAQFDGGAVQNDPLPPGTRRLRAYPRSSSVPVNARYFPSADGSEWIVTVDSGINLIIDGIDELGSVDITTDRIVIWTRGLDQPDLQGQVAQSGNTPLEIYMEGNIVFRQGERVVYAERMYYDATNQRGTVLGAEVLTPVPEYLGLLRLKANVLQQVNRDQFYAQDGFITSSRIGQPGYRLQSGQVFFEDHQRPVIDPYTGGPAIDPQTNEPVITHDRLATARNNLVYLGPVPVFYWPTFATDLTDPTLYVDGFSVKNDQIFGTQVLVDLDAYEVLGIRNRPKGTKWDFSVDYLSKRGLAGGTSFRYNRADSLFGVPSSYAGTFDVWGLHDSGLDNLGLGRQALVPESRTRYRNFLRHRQFLPDNYRVTAELGLISDRNFLESFFENEWDNSKDYTTGIELKRLQENSSWSITGDGRVNDFFTQTTQARADHFLLGQELFSDRVTWFEHTFGGYQELGVASTPKDPTDAAQWQFLPWEVPSQGERFSTKHELDLPLPFGPFRLTPYVLGAFDHWGEDLNGNPLDRLYGQTGLRASIPFWKVYPNAESGLFNVHGIAHKLTFDADVFVAESSADLDQLPLYEPVDDDNIEHFRSRFGINTFGGVTPIQFDERFYALRSGLASNVTSPSSEIADDLAAARLGLNQRWQTKRGYPGRRRIIDWIVLDTGTTFYANPDRDNFGEAVGLTDYDFRWHVGDQLTMLSSGLFDFFDDGQKIITVGGHLIRPPRGGLSLQFRHFEGPFTSNAVIATYSYHMSPKWISTMGSFIDITNNNYGQMLGLTRIGESLLFTIGVTNNSSKDIVGFNISIEPRFLPRTRTLGAGGAAIPMAGLYGLE
ncbi:MAG: organic solvent tolerance protein OstA [Pirellulales bacterium]|nr:organic solvent tolerance protein OstA [Pirellulales bacterium]